MTFPPSSPHKTALPLARAVQRRDNTRRQIIVALTSNDLKNGLNIELDGTPMRVRGCVVLWGWHRGEHDSHSG